MIYINKTENKITLKIKKLTSKTMNLFESTKKKIKKVKMEKNVSYLEINKVVLVHCNIVNNNYQLYSKVLHTFVPSK